MACKPGDIAHYGNSEYTYIVLAVNKRGNVVAATAIATTVPHWRLTGEVYRDPYGDGWDMMPIGHLTDLEKIIYNVSK